jgi:hypothetical protein
MVGELDTDNGDEQLEAYVRHVRGRYPKWWTNDAVPIGWSVVGHGISSFAPYVRPAGTDDDFLTEFTWPTDAETDEPIDWLRHLAVKLDRFPSFGRALAWKPAPFTRDAPLRSLWTARMQRPSFSTKSREARVRLGDEA